MFFFKVFINHLPKISWRFLRKITIVSLYWDVYDVGLWEKLTIIVKLYFIETRLQQSYDLQGYFLKIRRETTNILTIAVIIFLNEHLSEAVNRRCSAKKVFLKFHKIHRKKPVPVACNFLEKKTLLQVFEFCETFKDNFFNRTHPVLTSGIFF